MHASSACCRVFDMEEKLMKTRKLSIRFKLLIPVTIVILAICLTMGITSYERIKKGMVAMGVEEARMAAQVAEYTIDGELAGKIEPGSENSEEYQALTESMRQVQQDMGIAYMYTLYTDGSTVYYGVDTDTSANRQSVGNKFGVSYEEMADVFAGKEYVQDYIDYTEDGDLITVYMPLKNKDGEIVGAVGCDYDASNVVAKMHETVYSTLISGALCMVAAILLVSLILRSILKGLRHINEKLYDLVHNEGDLTQTLQMKSGDELELIANNVNSLLSHLHDVIANVAANSAELEASSQGVVKNLANAETGISDISATMEEMSAAMEETSASMNQVNESIGDVYKSIERISGDADRGKRSADQVMERAAQIYTSAEKEQADAHARAEELVSTVNEKIEKSRVVTEIGVLTENILNITEETSLLALNASIEAARAGDAGKGFAVVADEIGKLAANSAEAAEQIQNVSSVVIEAVNELAEKAEVITRFLDETAMNGYAKLLETSKSYQKDVGDMDEMMQMFSEQSGLVKGNVDQIKESIYAVNIAAEESAQGITNVTGMTVDLSSGVADIEQAAAINNQIAGQLSTEVHKFKL